MTSFDKYLFVVFRICIEYDKCTLTIMPQCCFVNHPLLLKLIPDQINMPRSAACVTSIKVSGLRQNINAVVVPEAIKHLINAFASTRITEMEDFCFMHCRRTI